MACGGCYTLAVCRHDADKEDTEERRRGYKGKMRAWFSNNNRPLITVPKKCAHSLPLQDVTFCSTLLPFPLVQLIPEAPNFTMTHHEDSHISDFCRSSCQISSC